MKKITLATLLVMLIADCGLYAAPRKAAAGTSTAKQSATRTKRTKKPNKRLMQAIDEADVKAFEQELDRSSSVANTQQEALAAIGRASLAMQLNKEDTKASRSEKGTKTRRLNKIISLLREKRASVLEKV